MQEMIALVASVVIGAVIILAVALVQWRGQHTSIDATQFVTAKSGVLDFAEIMEEDISNLGAGLSAAAMTGGSVGNAGGFVGGNAAFDTSSSSTIRRVEFYTWADTTADFSDTPPAPPAYPVNYQPYRVRYQWTVTGTARTLDPTTNAYDTVPTYLVERFVNDGSGYVKSGESVNTVTLLRFDLFDIGGTPVTPAKRENTRQIEVTLMAVSPLGGGTDGMIDTEAGVAPAVSESRWNKVFRPPNLARLAP